MILIGVIDFIFGGFFNAIVWFKTDYHPTIAKSKHCAHTITSNYFKVPLNQALTLDPSCTICAKVTVMRYLLSSLFK